MQAVAKTAQRILVDANLLARLRDAQRNALQLDAAHHLVRGAGRAAQEDRTGRAAASLHTAKPCVAVFDVGGFGAFAVHVALHHRVPALRQVVDHFVAGVGIL